MGNRSRLVVIGSAAAGTAGVGALLRAIRRGRVRAASPAHAPGHRHLPPVPDDRADGRPPPGERPFAKHHHGLRHPGGG
jgi:hypothetical protein